MDIQPDKQNIDEVFSNRKYEIDFYQREYRWGYEPVQRLLDDIFYNFDSAYSIHQNTPSTKLLAEQYPWYYLNTYVTNTIGGLVFIVDGQQRLTTFSLILLKLLSLSKEKDLTEAIADWLKSKIFTPTSDGRAYFMHDAMHSKFFDAIMHNKPINDNSQYNDITADNILKNYRLISSVLDDKLNDSNKVLAFIYYFMYRLVLINLSVDSQYVPMVFEVLNDRGVRLLPHEITKAKLLGQLDKTLIVDNKYSEKWDAIVSSLTIDSKKESEMDTFLSVLFYYVYGFKDEKQNRENYHRVLFDNGVHGLDLHHNVRNTVVFLDNDLPYYSNLYKRIIQYTADFNVKIPHLFYIDRRNFNDGNMAVNRGLIMAACEINDGQEYEKIALVAKNIDRLQVILKVQNMLNGIRMQKILPQLRDDLKCANLNDIDGIFNDAIKREVEWFISKSSSISSTYADDSILSYRRFRTFNISAGLLFMRNFFARIDIFIANEIAANVRYPVDEITNPHGKTNPFHIEHILANNKRNLDMYASEDEFNRDRDRAGAVLLMRGSSNCASGNEDYAEKLKTYGGKSFYWNESLGEDLYKNNPDFSRFTSKYNLNFRPIQNFTPESVEERQKLLFDLVKIIWNA